MDRRRVNAPRTGPPELRDGSCHWFVEPHRTCRNLLEHSHRGHLLGNRAQNKCGRWLPGHGGGAVTGRGYSHPNLNSAPLLRLPRPYYLRAIISTESLGADGRLVGEATAGPAATDEPFCWPESSAQRIREVNMAPQHSAPDDPGRSGLTDTELLAQHRRDIEALDRRILHLVCERLELARQIGEVKGRVGVPLRNFEVEAYVHRRFEEVCRALGVDPDVGRDLALFLIDKAVAEQASQKDAAYRGDALETLVVGGKGGMGEWFARFLRGQGHRVRIFDPAPGDSGFSEVSSMNAGVANADVVVLAVPMSVCGSLIDELAALGTSAVIVEICSLKGHLQPTLTAARAAGLRLVSCHPMFGPDTKMLCGRTLVFCTDGREEDRAVVQGLFESTSARLIELDIMEHDRRMGLVLGLAHLSNLVFARALMLSGFKPAEMREAAGVTFSKQLATAREVSEENPGLYFEIQALNATTPETGRWLEKSLADWLSTLRDRDEGRFAALMTECRAHLESIGNCEDRQ